MWEKGVVGDARLDWWRPCIEDLAVWPDCSGLSLL